MDDFYPPFYDDADAEGGGFPEGVDLEMLRQMYGDDFGGGGGGGYYDDDGNFIPVYAPRPEPPPAPRMPIAQLIDTCVVPSLTSTAGSILLLLALCVLCTAVCRLGRLRPSFAHSVHASAGVAAMCLFFGRGCLLPALYCVASYGLLRAPARQLDRRRGPFLAAATVACVLLYELLMPAEAWHSIRGVQMLLSMKAISLAFDLDRHSAASLKRHDGDDVGDVSSGSFSSEPQLLTAWRFAGYALSPGTAVFGPWMPYADYVDSIEEAGRRRLVTGRWLFAVGLRLPLSAAVSLVSSTCFGRWLMNDERRVWLVAYRDAQSFRFSHYFVGYLGELTAALAGFGSYEALPSRSGGSGGSGGGCAVSSTSVTSAAFVDSVAVTRPVSVELPRSLVDVVTSWNMPMHRWLKTYAFAPSRRALGTGAAVFVTYVASSLLHGANFQLAAVLLSLGLYSYVEHALRRTLASGFSACIEARACAGGSGKCCSSGHVRGAHHPVVALFNLGFGAVAVFHLAYLGVMFDSGDGQETGYDMRHTLRKWSALGFSSHYVALATYAFYWIVK